MGLQEDVNAGLAALSGPEAPSQLGLDSSGRCTVPVPMPASLVELEGGVLPVTVEGSGTGRFFTLSSPIAAINGQPSSDFFRALLNRQFHADQVAGGSFAVGGAEDMLVAVYHWMLDSITPEEFVALFKNFISATLDLIDEVDNMARRERLVKPIHKGRPR